MSKSIGIYNTHDNDIIVNICDTIQAAAEWLGCTTSQLYKSLQINGIMSYKNYTLELINDEDMK